MWSFTENQKLLPPRWLSQGRETWHRGIQASQLPRHLWEVPTVLSASSWSFFVCEGTTHVRNQLITRKQQLWKQFPIRGLSFSLSFLDFRTSELWNRFIWGIQPDWRPVSQASTALDSRPQSAARRGWCFFLLLQVVWSFWVCRFVSSMGCVTDKLVFWKTERRNMNHHQYKEHSAWLPGPAVELIRGHNRRWGKEDNKQVWKLQGIKERFLHVFTIWAATLIKPGFIE